MYVLNVMAMHLLRGEGPLEPVTYFVTYLLALGPAILVVSALAISFECIPVLSGRVGDVLYFFIWMVLLAVGAMGAQGGGAGSFLDVMGLGFILGQVHSVTGSEHLAIGMTPFNPAVAPWVLPPMSLSLRRAPAAPRHRAARGADPARGRSSFSIGSTPPACAARARRQADTSSAGSPLLLKPLTRLVSGAGERLVAVAPAPLRAIVAETVMTLCQSPLLLLAWLGVLVATLVAPEIKLLHLLPARHRGDPGHRARRPLDARPGRRHTAAALQHAHREARTTPGSSWAPRHCWRLLFCVPPAIRIAFSSPGSALSLVIAAGFMAALATALGLLTRTPKAFMGVFLLFVYLVLNGAQVPALDFAGWNGVATSTTRVGYLVATLVLAALAAAKHRWDMTRES